nr:hypothetical protein [Candidatus Sigynarchaeota archaeon]
MPIENKNRTVCTGCALLCDDISIDVQFGTIQAVHNACLRGTKKFQFASKKDRIKNPAIKDLATGSSSDATWEAAIDKAVDLITHAKHFVIAGVSRMNDDAQELALNLAAKLKATLAIQDHATFTRVFEAIQNHGIELFTLGETINNADLVLFWGANPIDLSPKMLVKTAFSRGRYRQSGKEVKKVAVIDDYPTPTMERADIKAISGDTSHGAVLATLARALVDRKILEPSWIETSGIPKKLFEEPALSDELLSQLKDMAVAIDNAEYCCIFLGEAVLNQQSLGDERWLLDGMLSLVRAINAKRKMAVLPLFYTWNFAGLLQALATTADKVEVIDMRDMPSRAGNGTVVLSLGSDFISKASDDEYRRLSELPVVCVDFKRTPTTGIASVILPPAMTGIESGGTATRLDGVTLNLSPPIGMKANMKSDQEILQLILEKIGM